MNGDLHTFALSVRKRVRNQYDMIIAIDGMRGRGKSTLAIQLGKHIDPNFSMEQNIIFQPNVQDVMNKIRTLPKYSVIILDEAVRVLYKLDWYTKGQRILNKFFDLAREEKKVVIFCLPRFYDLNEKMRNDAVSMWIRVYKRGFAFARTRSENPDAPEPWEQKRNYKFIEKFFTLQNTRCFTPQNIGKVTKHIIGFVFSFDFPDMVDEEKLRYETLKKAHAYEGLEEEMEGERNIWRPRYYLAIYILTKRFNASHVKLAKLMELEAPSISQAAAMGKPNDKGKLELITNIVTDREMRRMKSPSYTTKHSNVDREEVN